MVRSSVDGDVRVVTLARPERRNALTNTGLNDLAATFEDATEPVIYLHGDGEAFCAGADLDVVAALDRESAVEFARLGQRAARAIESYDSYVPLGSLQLCSR